MKALIAPSYGPLAQLTIVDLPAPVAGPGQLTVRVQAAALNALDVKLALGSVREFMPVEHPLILGMDAAGVVDAVGAGVTRFAVGDEVLLFAGFAGGTVAEFTRVEDGPYVTARPAGLDAVRAAALPEAALTAASVLDAADVRAGQSALVIGATGGVGAFTVQLLNQAGVRVIATAQAADAEPVRGFGAAETVDYTAVDPVTETLRLQPGGVDVVVDLIASGPALAATAAAARPGGRLISVLGGPASFDRGVRPTYVQMSAPDGRLAELAQQVVAGRLQVPIAAEYPFADARQAVVDYAGKHTRGKVVISL